MLTADSWRRSMSRIGIHRARVFVAWLRRREGALGACVDADVDIQPLPPAIPMALQWHSLANIARFRNADRVARDMPIDIVQRILGDASLQATPICVRAERQRMLDAAAQYYADDKG